MFNKVCKDQTNIQQNLLIRWLNAYIYGPYNIESFPKIIDP